MTRGTPDNARAPWRKLRRRRWVLAALFVGWVPYAIVFDVSRAGVFLLYFTGVAIAFFYMMATRCPQCGLTFHVKQMQVWFIGIPFIPHCANCGISLGAELPPRQGGDDPASANSRR